MLTDPSQTTLAGTLKWQKLDESVRERTDQLDALGNTTAATGKGFAIGSAALTATRTACRLFGRNSIRFNPFGGSGHTPY